MLLASTAIIVDQTSTRVAYGCTTPLALASIMEQTLKGSSPDFHPIGLKWETKQQPGSGQGFDG